MSPGFMLGLLAACLAFQTGAASANGLLLPRGSVGLPVMVEPIISGDDSIPAGGYRTQEVGPGHKREEKP
jgi:hypothetical protein